MPDAVLRPRDASRGAHDAQLYRWSRNDFIARLYPKDMGRGAHDVQLRPANLFIFEGAPPPPPSGPAAGFIGLLDFVGYKVGKVSAVSAGFKGLLDFIGYSVGLAATGFPTQYSGLKVYYNGAIRELCLVAVADAPAGMGAAPRISKGGVTYAVYLVETTDPDATPVRLRTTTGTKSVRRKT